MTARPMPSAKSLRRAVPRSGRLCRLAGGWLALLVLATALVLPARPALSQPAVGSTMRGALGLGWGASVPLPEGEWRVTATPILKRKGFDLETIVLRNTRDDALIPLMVVRHTRDNRTTGWGPLGCQAGPPGEGSTEFMRNAHGSTGNDLVNRCSRVWPIRDYEQWRTRTASGDPYWKEVGGMALGSDAAPIGGGMLLVQVEMQEHLRRRLNVELFVRPPQGRTPQQFREAVLAGRGGVEADLFSTWTAVYVASTQLSFLSLTPRPITALAWPAGPATVTASAPAPAKAQVASAPAPAPGPATVPAPAPAAPAAVPAAAPTTATAVTTTTAAAAKPPAAGAVPGTPTLAIEQQNRDLQAQLEQMRKTLAQLQATVEKGAAQPPPAQDGAARPFVPRPPAANRKALVIGNDRYTEVAPLANAVADAEAMARTLQAVGFTVTKHLNLSEKRFKQALRDFRMQVQGGDEVIFFFAGHGVQLGAANYLLPVDIRADHEEQVKDEAIPLQRILDDLNERKAKFSLAVIDACRDNPFQSKGRSIGGRGLAPTSAASGQMVMYSAGAGQQALDRLGPSDPERNGLFTRILLREMTRPGQSVDRVLRTVRTEVVRLARGVGHEQTPALYDQAIGEFFFAP